MFQQLKNLLLAALLLPATQTALAMPRMDIHCETTDHVEGISFNLGFSRYSGDLSPESVSYDDEDLHQVAEANVAQYMNNGGKLFLKFYEDSTHSSDADRTGYKIKATLQRNGKWLGTATYFEVKYNPGPETSRKSRPVVCKDTDAPA